MEVILGFALMAALFIALAYLLSKDNFVGPAALLLFSGFGILTMNMMAGAIYTEWNNTATYNSSGMVVPTTLVQISFWSVWVWLLLVVLGLLFWVFKHLAKGGKE